MPAAAQPVSHQPRWLEWLTVRLARLLLAVFYRRIEVVGVERLPAGPLVLVANHNNSLIDPLLLFGTLAGRRCSAAGSAGWARPLRPRFLAKSTLWNNPLLRPVLALGGAIPVYRRQDGVDMASNRSTFAACHELLAAGGAIALFPEGISHSDPALAPIKTGAARIALEAEEEWAAGGGADGGDGRPAGRLGVTIVPIGLLFDQPERFRSRALVQVGEAIDPAPELELSTAEPREAVRRLTERIAAGLASVTVEYESWQEAALIGRAAELFDRPELPLPRDRHLEEEMSLRRAIADRADRLAVEHPERYVEAAAAIREYSELLAATGLTDSQVAARYPMPRVATFLLRRLPWLLVVLPAALVGVLLNYPPYRLTGWLSHRLTRRPDVLATYKLYPSLLLFPLTWLAEAAAAGWWLGLAAALGVGALAPLAGWVALLARDRYRGLTRGSAAYLRLAFGRRLAGELRGRRRAAYEAVMELAAVSSAPPPGAGGAVASG